MTTVIALIAAAYIGLEEWWRAVSFNWNFAFFIMIWIVLNRLSEIISNQKKSSDLLTILIQELRFSREK